MNETLKKANVDIIRNLIIYGSLLRLLHLCKCYQLRF